MRLTGTGEGVLAAMRDDGAPIPTIIVTVEDAKVGTLGADDHLTKPIDAERLGRWMAGLGGARERSNADPAG